MSTARGLPRSRAWLRVLVLLLAVLVPGAPCEVAAMPVASVEIVEYDAFDTALRPPADGAHRAVAPPRPACRPARTPGVPPGRPLPPPAEPPYTLDVLRTVVLRC